MILDTRTKLGHWIEVNIGWSYLENNTFLFLDDFWYNIYIIKKPIFKQLFISFKEYGWRRS